MNGCSFILRMEVSGEHYIEVISINRTHHHNI